MQRQNIPYEEEPLQGKILETIQRLEPEEEEKLQTKSVVQREKIPEEEEPLQGKMIGIVQRQEIPEKEEPLQRKRENNTGMPDKLKAGVENLSGIDISDVKVHFNSDKPAKVGALAYTQGTHIHIAPGQERHLPHESWHVIQQAQGRVRPTFQLKDVSVNDDVGLEREADVMSAKAFALGSFGRQEFLHVVPRDATPTSDLLQCKQIRNMSAKYLGKFERVNDNVTPYAADEVINSSDIDELVAAMILQNNINRLKKHIKPVNIQILTGVHGDKNGNLAREGAFRWVDQGKYVGTKDETSISITNVAGQTKEFLEGHMVSDKFAVILAWCYSKQSFKNLKDLKSQWDWKTDKEIFNEIDYLRKVTRDNPKDADAWYRLGLTYNRLQCYDDEAQKAFAEATKINPNNAEAWSELFKSYYRQKNFTEARKALDKAIELDSIYIAFRDLLPKPFNFLTETPKGTPPPPPPDKLLHKL